jgi:methionyl aminopeptidase
MIYLKNKNEIKIMRQAGRIAAEALGEVEKKISSGVKVADLDKIAEKNINKFGASSSFKTVDNYKFTICATPNEQVVHGIPGSYILKEGDILGVDLGALYKGFHSDMARTFPVGDISKEKKRFLSTGEKALKEATKRVEIGNRIGDISSTIQKIIEQAGYSVVREFVGHGVGRQLHEDPVVPGRGKKGLGEKIEEGLVLAVEVIYNKGESEVQMLSDGWTVITKDNAPSGLFELTVVATKKGPLVLTRA